MLFADTSIQSWVNTIEFLSLVRNHLIHGAVVINEELGNFAEGKTYIPNLFIKGQKMQIDDNLLNVYESKISILFEYLNNLIVSVGIHEDIFNNDLIY